MGTFPKEKAVHKGDFYAGKPEYAKTSDNEAMLQEIVQNTEMGKNTLDELMGLTYDQKLKDEMMRQKTSTAA